MAAAHLHGTLHSGSNAAATPANRSYRIPLRILALIVAGLFLLSPLTVMAAPTPKPSVDLSQCRNGGFNDPAISPCIWVNGNLNTNQAHFYENESIPYRAVVDNLVSGTGYVLTIGYDIKHGGKHAIDYLTHYDRIAEAVDPCGSSDNRSAISPCAFGGTYPIPQPAGSPQPQGSFASLPAAERFFTIYGGTLTGLSYPVQGNLLATGDSETRIAIAFTAGASTTVIAWGGHISDQDTWGAGNSATGINGAPYHMRLIGLTGGNAGNLGNQDRSTQAGSVAPEPPVGPSGASLTLVKEVVNDNGGEALPSSFQIHLRHSGNLSHAPGSPQAGDSIGTSYSELPAGTYLISESGPAGYALSFSGDCAPIAPNATTASITLADGDLKECVLVNDDSAARLTVVKQFIDLDGGTATLEDVTLLIGDTEVDSGVATVVMPGQHQVREVGPAGYDASFGGDCDEDGNVSVALGESKACLITNDDRAPILTVTKVVVNDHGGEATVASFPLFVDETAVTSGIPQAYHAGTHWVSETGSAQYDATIGGDCAADGSITLAVGDADKECTITNDDRQPFLTVRKEVVNDDGGSFAAEDAELSIDGFSAPQGEPVGLVAGTHTVSETPVAGYRMSFAGDCDEDGDVQLLPGDDKECVVRNDDIAPRLTVTKEVVNDNGGSLAPEDAILLVGQVQVLSGVQTNLTAGEWTVSELAIYGYDPSFRGDCAEDGSISLAVGDVKSCTITNDDRQPRLTVIKEVVNDHGGSAQVSDFLLSVDESSVESGIEAGFDAGSYQVSESGPAGYAASYGGDCAEDGSITLQVGDNKTCLLRNDDIQPRLTVSKQVINDHGGSALPGDFPLYVDGLSVPNGEELGYQAGLHQVSEDGSAGYALSWGGDCDEDGRVALLPGDVKHCILTNDDIQPLLTVVKVVINDNGGTAAIEDALLYVGGTQVTSGEQNGFNASTYLVREESPFGYAGSLGGDCPADGWLTLAPGDIKVCVFTNDDIQPLLTITKEVVNDNGGLAGVSDFQLWVGDQLVLSGQQMGFNASTYQVSEAGPAGYDGSFSGDCSESGSVSLSVGEVKACKITNDDRQPRLTVTKEVVNDDGGDASVGSFALKVGNASVLSGEPMGFDAGTYQVSETGPSGYSATYLGDCAPDGSITLAVGDEDKECTIRNDDIAPRLTVTKEVTNDDGGDAEVADFPLWVDEHAVLSGIEEEFYAGSYVVSETGQFGYAGSIGGDCAEDGSISLAIGESYACTITNDDIAPRLTVTKEVTNDNGGDAEVADFPLWIDDMPTLSGEEQELLAGSYVVSETGLFGYAGSIGGDCAEDGSISLAVGEVKSCTITNDDIQPRLTVTKEVTNDNGGTAAVGDFPLWVDETSVASGIESGFDAGSYVVSETGLFGYAGSIGGDCAEDGSISLAVGEVKSCSITNDDIQPRLTITKRVINDAGGTAEVADFSLSVGSDGVRSGEEEGFDAGQYQISESGPGGYAASFAGDCDVEGNVSLLVGQVKSCTITNDDIAPILTVIKVVVNDSGGDAGVADYSLSVGSEGVASGVPEPFHAGSYQVSESGPGGYAAAYSGDCAEDGSIELALADEKTCTITNDDIPARLRVVKVVILDDGGVAAPEDFSFHVEGTDADPADFAGAASPGVLVTLDAGAYRVTEAFTPEYRTTYSAGCSGVAALDQDLVCTVTNDDLSLASRTQGFWSTHTKFTQTQFSAHMGGSMTLGGTSHSKLIDSDGELFGAWYSDISKKSNGQARTPLEQARMQLAQQLVTAKLNCAAFGCAMGDWLDIQAADLAYAGTDRAAILAAAAEMDAFNNANDGMPLPASAGKLGGASPKTSQSLANKVFWNTP